MMTRTFEGDKCIHKREISIEEEENRSSRPWSTPDIGDLEGSEVHDSASRKVERCRTS